MSWSATAVPICRDMLWAKSWPRINLNSMIQYPEASVGFDRKSYQASAGETSLKSDA